MFSSFTPFHRGVDRDTSEDLVRDHARDLLNFRLTSVDGKGVVLVNLKGNEHQFDLTDGFLPLGYVTYKGIAFIFSFNSGTLEGEIGCYPSPIDCNGGYQHVYKPLQNWNGAIDPRSAIVRQDFRTTLLNFSCERQLEVQARISWDNSVELFFADWRNPLRHVNTGYDIDTGICNNRLLWEGSFPQGIDVFFETCKHPYATNVDLDTGGGWQAGNVFLYWRYKTIDLNPTSFLGETGPVQVSTDALSLVNTLDGDPDGIDTGRSIVVDLTNIDANFPYLEAAFVLFHANTFTVGLIDELFAIPPGSSTLQIKITGKETVVDLALADLINKKVVDDSPRSIVQLENRLFGANWRSSFAEYQQLEDTAKLVEIKPPDPSELLGLADGTFRNNLVGPGQYKDFNNTLTNLGYFRGEAYTFAVVWVFNNGKESVPYPMKGYDAWFDPGATTPNFKGILRFPANYQAGYALYDGAASEVMVMGVKFDTSSAPLTLWMQENICGFYFVRGDRNETLVYQGAVGRAWKPGADVENDADGLLTCTFGPPNAEVTSNWIPDICRRDIDVLYGPSRLHQCPSSDEIGASRLEAVSGKHGLFSTDHFFNKTLIDGLHTVFVQGYAELSILLLSGETDMIPDHMLEWVDFTQASSALKGQVFCYNVTNNSYNVIGGGFTSRFAEGGQDTAGQPQMFYYYNDCLGGCREEYANRDMAQRRYIGLSFTEPGTTGALEPSITDSNATAPDGVPVVNIYRSDPEFIDITTLYDPPTVQYKRISDFIPITQWDTIVSTIFYHGDCFLQRTYHKHLHDTGYHDEDDSADFKFYVYGTIVGLVQELSINSAMRNEAGSTDGDATYYPERLQNDPKLYARSNNEIEESDLQNEGYNSDLSLMAQFGNDPFLPFKGKRFPVRIRYSEPYTNDMFADGYLDFKLGSYKDFDHRLGEMVHIGVHKSSLFSVQESGVNYHYVNDRALLSQDASEGQLLLGSGDVLSQKTFNVSSEIGSRSQWSVIVTDGSVYGYDDQKRVIWRMTGRNFEMLDTLKSFHRDVLAISEVNSDHSDIIHTIPDAPVCTGGVTAFWDRKHMEVGWTFIIPDAVDVDERHYDTLVFSEQFNAYMGRRSHYSPFYIKLNEDLLSMDPDGAPYGTSGNQGSFYLHDKTGVPFTEFYGAQQQCFVELVVNSDVGYPNVYNALKLSVSPIQLLRMDFVTELQSSEIAPFLPQPLYLRSLWMENRWHVPLPTATAVQAIGVNEYAIGSPLRGKWLRVKSTWETDQEIEFRSMETHWSRSFQ